jgi:hypothetical protein
MVPFIPTFSGVSTNVLDLTSAIAPFSGAALAGVFLSSLAGIVVTVLVDRWQTRRQAKLSMTPTADVVTLSKAA